MKSNKVILLISFALIFAFLLSFSVGATADSGEGLFDGEGDGSNEASLFSQPFSFLSKLASGGFHVVYLVLFAVCAMLLCFYGYGLLRYCLGLLTFGGALYLVYSVALQLEFFVDAKSKAIGILISVLIGLILSALAFCMTKFGAFLFVSILSYLILSGFGDASVVFAVLAIALGIIASLFVRVSVVALSSFVGGMILGASLSGIIKIVAFPYVHIPLGLIFAIFGMAIQFSFAKTKREKRKEKREKRRREEYYGEEEYDYEEEYDDEDEYEQDDEYEDEE